MEDGQQKPPIVAATVDDQSTIQRLTVLYAENAKVVATFWEWRHKLMERFFAVLGGTVIGGAWIYHEQDLRRILFILPAVAGVYSFVSYLMDQVNRKILLSCYETGKNIEKQLGPVSGAYTILWDRRKSLSYTYILRAFYLSAGALLLVLSVFAATCVR